MNAKAIRSTFSIKLVLWALLLALFAGVGHAGESTTSGQAVLDGEGRILRLYNGAYGDLFPESPGVDPNNPVLALEVIQPDGTTWRQLVPGTESVDTEDWETLIYEPTSKTTYLLWQDLYSHLHPRLMLTSFDGDDWQEVIQIWSSAFDRKGSPGLVVTRETTSARRPDGASLTDRTIVHLTWWQESPATSRKLYAPVILEDGEYIGWTPVFDLADFLPGEDQASSIDAGLANAIRVQRGQDHHKIVIGFLHPTSHRMVTLEVDLLSQELTDLANKARAQIIEMGAFSRSPTWLAQQIYDVIFNAGSGFHTASLQYVAGEIRDEILAGATGAALDVDDVAHKARAQIIEMGARMAINGLADGRESEILEVGQTPADGSPNHFFKVTVLSDRPAPSVNGKAEIYLSESGTDLLVAWEDEESGRIYYQDSHGDGWNEVAYIDPTETLDRAAIHQLLQQRLR